MTIKINDLASYYGDNDRKNIAETTALKNRRKVEASKLKQQHASKENAVSINSDPEARIQSLMAGGTPERLASWDEKIAHQRQIVQDIDDALDRRAELARENDKAANKRLIADIRPEHDKATKKLVDAMAALHAAYLPLYAAKRHLLGNGLALGGLFNADAEPLLGIPTDRTGNLKDFFRDAVKEGFLSAVPTELA